MWIWNIVCMFTKGYQRIHYHKSAINPIETPFWLVKSPFSYGFLWFFYGFPMVFLWIPMVPSNESTPRHRPRRPPNGSPNSSSRDWRALSMVPKASTECLASNPLQSCDVCSCQKAMNTLVTIYTIYIYIYTLYTLYIYTLYVNIYIYIYHIYIYMLCK